MEGEELVMSKLDQPTKSVRQNMQTDKKREDLLDAEEGIAEQLLTNGAGDGDGDIVVYAPPQLLDDMRIVGLDMEGKLEVGASVFMTTVDLGLDGESGQDVEQAVIHVSRRSFKEPSAAAYYKNVCIEG